ncbi:hypothetical protein [Sphingomonas cavernae]|uniref:Uncharacterized protein n=1 Tax=Sphingomonas cavernae TaxID=2320861 RepID=A0A418WJS3_9SPHN|nr:hypothetical protein [Sphingomonas cavernae]RJF90293.1 hypothetical protein D3876_08460 [Sphingomonas cavernae]
MLKQRRAAADAVRATFLPAEHAQDQAAIRAARCLATALEARATANLPLGTGVDAIAHLCRGTALAVEARQSFIAAHRALSVLPADIGLGVVAWGDSGGCPDIEPTGRASLAAVA